MYAVFKGCERRMKLNRLEMEKGGIKETVQMKEVNSTVR